MEDSYIIKIMAGTFVSTIILSLQQKPLGFVWCARRFLTQAEISLMLNQIQRECMKYKCWTGAILCESEVET